jgi:intraflagellar transport protein 172
MDPHPPPSWRSGKLAAAGPDRIVTLYDDAGERRDKFKTKGLDATGASSYVVRGLAFSPDGTMLAVGQSDGGAFVYR